MAVFQPIDANKHFVLLGNRADPVVFGVPCGITGYTFNPGITKRDTPVYDCLDPTSETQNFPTVTGSAYTLQMTGVLSVEYRSGWRDWFHVDSSPRMVRFQTTEGYYEGLAILSSYEEGATRDTDVTVSATIDWLGKPAFVESPAA